MGHKIIFTVAFVLFFGALFLFAKYREWMRSRIAEQAKHQILVLLAMKRMTVTALVQRLKHRYSHDDVSLYLTQLRATGMVNRENVQPEPYVGANLFFATERGRELLRECVLGNGSS